MTQGWDIETLKQIMEQPVERPKYIVTDDKDEFLDRMEGIAKNGLKQKGDNLKCLEMLDKVKAVREGADIFEIFEILREWNNKC